ncbi:G-protein coupled receptor 83 isoform X2 [Rhodnius prolixus]|uniref:G-protein coupled receptor 83 isoform X2 n=1 Tax=Rhodnius prolixus TaxID=13249 RepID=UPI003D18A32B
MALTILIALDIPLHVSTLTLLLIAWDRHRFLKDPMKPRIPAFVCATGSWLTAICLVLPYPVYTTYMDLGKYMPQFHGVGICAVNLQDDMQEYVRGLFIALYVLPLVVTAYLYVQMSRELQHQEGPLPVMMYEGIRGNTRTSTGSHDFRPEVNHISCHRYRANHHELFEAELDIRKEKRTHKYLGAIATIFAICLCPLMVLRLAKLALTETYENSGHFDITYTMFVWIAFLPTTTTPALYASWRMSRTTKERLRGYLRLSGRNRSRSSEGSTAGANPTVASRVTYSARHSEAGLSQASTLNNSS